MTNQKSGKVLTPKQLTNLTAKDEQVLGVMRFAEQHAPKDKYLQLPLSRVCKSHKVTTYITQAMINLGYLKQSGPRLRPVYRWDFDKPLNIHMAENVHDEAKKLLNKTKSGAKNPALIIPRNLVPIAKSNGVAKAEAEQVKKYAKPAQLASSTKRTRTKGDPVPRYQKALLRVYNLTKSGYKKVPATQIAKKYNVSGSLITVLKKVSVLQPKNDAAGKNKYKWNAKVPNEAFAKDVISCVSQYVKEGKDFNPKNKIVPTSTTANVEPTANKPKTKRTRRVGSTENTLRKQKAFLTEVFNICNNNHVKLDFPTLCDKHAVGRGYAWKLHQMGLLHRRKQPLITGFFYRWNLDQGVTDELVDFTRKWVNLSIAKKETEDLELHFPQYPKDRFDSLEAIKLTEREDQQEKEQREQERIAFEQEQLTERELSLGAKIVEKAAPVLDREREMKIEFAKRFYKLGQYEFANVILDEVEI